MGGHRFFIKQVDPSSKEIKFSPDVAHQIQHVLRLKKGDCVVVLDGEGRAYQVELIRFESGLTAGKILEVGEAKSDLNVRLHLFFPLSKREKVKWILQKGTEVGVHSFHPFISHRSLVQSSEMNMKRKTRWESIMKEAAEQSGRHQLPGLNNPESLQDAAKAASASLDKVIAAIVGEDLRNLKDVLLDVKQLFQIKQGIPTLGLFVGPEGGFSVDEIDVLKQSGAETVSLGRLVLRLETAAILFPALVMYELSDLQ